MPKLITNEKNVIIKFEGWEADIFICENGDLGITVAEFGKTHTDAEVRCVDIFVDKEDVNSVHYS